MINMLRGSRPFPIDHERQRRCSELLESLGMTQSELSIHLGVSKQYIGALLSGRELSLANEKRIADFFGVPHDALFPPRTAGEIAQMREREAREKAESERMRKERMALREQALAGLRESA